MYNRGGRLFRQYSVRFRVTTLYITPWKRETDNETVETDYETGVPLTE